MESCNQIDNNSFFNAYFHRVFAVRIVICPLFFFCHKELTTINKVH
jgi:hypothetical protein